MASEAERPVEPDFEKELENVERIVELLEHGELPLEEAILKFESGSRSLKKCYQILETARKRIEILGSSSSSTSGESPSETGKSPSWQELDPADHAREASRSGDPEAKD